MTNITEFLKINADLIEQDFSQNVCTICLGVIGDNNKAITKCGHSCLSCLLESLERKMLVHCVEKYWNRNAQNVIKRLLLKVQPNT